MLNMDVFNADPFSVISMTNAVEKLGYTPSLLGDMGIFTPEPVTTERIMIEERTAQAALIQTSARGTPPRQTGNELRKMHSFGTVRLADQSRITADQLQGIRAFGSFSETQSLQVEIARRQARIKNNFALTKENLRLGCVLGGIVKDANGDTIINWADVFGQTIEAPLEFDFSGDGSEGVLRTQFAGLVRQMKRKLLMGNQSDQVQVVGIAGDNIFDKFVASKEIRATYLNQTGASELRGRQDFERFTFGGATVINYRSTDDATQDATGATTSKGAVGVDPNEVWFFPMSGPGGDSIFKMAMAPAERFEFVNTPGRDLYSFIVTDKDRDSWADVEMYSYLLPVCTLPGALRKGVIAG